MLEKKLELGMKKEVPDLPKPLFYSIEATRFELATSASRILRPVCYIVPNCVKIVYFICLFQVSQTG